MPNFIPLSMPSIKGNEWEYVKNCLDANLVSSSGEYIDKFEKNICKYLGVKYAVATNSGTSALHLALKLCDVNKNDEVLAPTITFISSINAIKYLNANPVFFDCDDFYNIDENKVLNFLNSTCFFDGKYTVNKKSHKKIKAIIIAHIFGFPAKVSNLITFCKNNNIKVIEDSCESLGSKYISGELKNKFTGTIGDVAVISFSGNKIITTGRGGMLVTNSYNIANQAKYYANQCKDDPVRYVHNNIGYNYKLTNVQAAIGVAQLEEINNYINIKQQNFNLYKQQIENINGLKLVQKPNYAKHNYWFYCLQIDENIYKYDKETLMAHLAKNGIQSKPLWQPNHLQKPFAHNTATNIKNALKLWETTLNIPCSVSLTSKQISYICDVLKN